MKIVLLLFVLVIALGFAMKKTFDSSILLAKRLQTERNLTLNTQAAMPQTVALI
jgi:hypothetical protein